MSRSNSHIYSVEADRDSSHKNEPRVALACSGLGDVRRGYERYFEELYSITHDEMATVLFRGGRYGPGIRLPRVSRKSPVTALFGAWEARYETEVLSFALSLLPMLVVGRYDLLHFADYGLGLYAKVPAWLGIPRLLFTNGSFCSPEACTKFDYVHVVNPLEFQQALQHGIERDRLFFIPHGVNTERFTTVDFETKRALRARYGISQESFVVVSVGYLGAGSHKRVHWVIDEVAHLKMDVSLLLVGEQDRTRSDLANYLQTRLAGRSKVMTLPDESVPDAYGLADVSVLGSIKEAFGIVLIEAMASGIPVIAHDNPVIRWVVGDAGSIIDMTKPKRLTSEIQFYIDNPATLQARGREARRRAIEAYDWKRLKQDYLEMYRRCGEFP